MADDERGCDQLQVRLYVVGVTEPTPEPTLADVLAAITAQGEALAALALKVEGIDNKTDDLTQATADGFAHVMTELAGVKSDVAASEDRLRGEIRATEADLSSRIGAVQDVLRTLKADLAAHVNDPNAHRPHAA